MLDWMALVKLQEQKIITPSTNPPNAYQVPRISFIKYVGDKGASGGGGGGDASGNLDLSGNISACNVFSKMRS